MEKRSILWLFTLLMFVPGAKAQWVDLPEPDVLLVQDMHFFDEQTGVLGSYEGIFRTSNAGQDWQMIAPSSSVEDIDIAPDGMNGLAGCDGGEVLFTHDAGNTWQSSATVFAHNVTEVCAASANHCFVRLDFGGNYEVHESTDAGTSWSLRPDIFPFNQMMFIDANNGVMATSNGFYHTTDGGQNWVQAVSPGSSVPAALCFTTPQEGWVVGYEGMISHTTNGGLTWTIQNTDSLYSLHCVAMDPSGFGLAGGYTFETGVQPPLYLTTDHGATWTLQDFVQSAVYSISVPNAQTAYICESAPDVWKYNNAVGVAEHDGRSVQLYPNPTSDRLQLRLDQGQVPVQCRILDMNGREMLSWSRPSGDEMDLSALAIGIYLVEVDLTDGSRLVDRVEKR